MPAEARSIVSQSGASTLPKVSTPTPRVGAGLRLERVKASLCALRDLAAQSREDLEVQGVELATLLEQVLSDLNDLHDAIDAQLEADARTPGRYEAVLRGHLLRSSERQLYEMARLAQAARRAADVEGVLRAAWVAALVMSVEVENLAGDLVSVCGSAERRRR